MPNKAKFSQREVRVILAKGVSCLRMANFSGLRRIHGLPLHGQQLAEPVHVDGS
ncbi:hypothetical protein D3C72_2497730 [compost metagenome]